MSILWEMDSFFSAISRVGFLKQNAPLCTPTYMTGHDTVIVMRCHGLGAKTMLGTLDLRSAMTSHDTP